MKTTNYRSQKPLIEKEPQFTGRRMRLLFVEAKLQVDKMVNVYSVFEDGKSKESDEKSITQNIAKDHMINIIATNFV